MMLATDAHESWMSSKFLQRLQVAMMDVQLGCNEGRREGRPVSRKRKVCKIIESYPAKKITRNILSNDHLPSILTVMPDASW